MKKISGATVRADFNDLTAVLHYTRAAHDLGLWASERAMIERTFTDLSAPLLEAGCGAGRVTLGLWSLGYRNLTAFDFAEELVDQARAFAANKNADAIRFHHADATRLSECRLSCDISPEANKNARDATGRFKGALFMFNGLMQIPGRENRRTALRELQRVCSPGAPLLFTTHDRTSSSTERALWRLEKVRWEKGAQDPRLVEFGDRYFEEEGTGRTFMHLPSRAEILDDLAVTGWMHETDSMRSRIAKETRAVRDFSDECRLWVARRV
jgi:SAM-dependent methyltransferase